MSTNQKKEEQLLNLIDTCSSSSLSEIEREILQQAKAELTKPNAYLPRVVADLEETLRPLAIKQELSNDVKPLYKLITSHEFKDKGLGIGLASRGMWL